jgi:hypothetical protein
VRVCVPSESPVVGNVKVCVPVDEGQGWAKVKLHGAMKFSTGRPSADRTMLCTPPPTSCAEVVTLSVPL